MTHRRRACGRLTVTWLVVVVALWASPAFAHTQLESSDPPDNAQLTTAPAAVRLRFTRPVEITPGTFTLRDGQGVPIAAPLDGRPGSTAAEVVANLPALKPGLTVIAWRVVASDSHPRMGEFRFTVLPTTGVELAAADPPSGRPGSLAEPSYSATLATTSVIAGAARLIGFAGLTVLAGGIAFLFLLWPRGLADRRSRIVLGGAWIAAVSSAVAALAFQATTLAGRPLSALDSEAFQTVLATRFGLSTLARIALLFMAVSLFALAALRTGWRRWTAAGALGSLLFAALVTLGLAGHPAVDSPAALAVTLDAVHLAAVSVWLGGLALLVVAVLRRDPVGSEAPEGPRDEMAAVAARFSPLASAAVAVILVTGTIPAWWRVGNLEALVTTTYGRLIMAKAVLLAAMAAVGYLSRRWIQARAVSRLRTSDLRLSMGPGAKAASIDDDPPLSQLRTTVAAEVLIAIVVLAASAALVAANPGG